MRQFGTPARVVALLLFAAAQAAAEPMTGREIARTVLPSVALVVVERSAGAGARRATAFFVSPMVLATSAHVVEDARRVGVLLSGEKALRLVRVIGVDPAADLALLELAAGASPGPPALDLAPDDGIAVGDRVYVAGNPLGLKGSLSEGLLSAVRGKPERPLYQISAPISSGSSGGPVLSETGQVVGVVKSMASAGQNLNFAVPVAALRALIARAGVTQAPVAGGETATRAPAPRPDTQAPSGKETTPQDPAGWQTARWGMSPAEVKAALLLIDRPRVRPRPAKGPLYPAFVLLTEIGGIEYRVALDFDIARDTFQRVRFVPKVAGAARPAFDSLAALLVKKYGAPAESGSENAQQRSWTFPSTVIRLRWARRPGDEGPGVMLLAYQSRQLVERPAPRDGDRGLDDLDKL
jgi:hypothetical protein